MRQSRKALVFLFLSFFASRLSAGISFSGLDLNSSDRLLFTVEQNIPGALSYRSLFSVSIKNGTAADTPDILTCYPEKMELLSNGNVLQVRNRFGTALYSFLSSNLVWTDKTDVIPVCSDRRLPVSVSPDGKWECYIRKIHSTSGALILENTAAHNQIVLSSSTEISYTDVPVRWAPDSSTVLYEKEGAVYFCSPSAVFKNIQISENFRKIGPGTIHSVGFARGQQLVYIDGDIIYRLNVSELYTQALYSSFIGSSNAAAILPVSFNPATDIFQVNDDASELAVIQARKIISYYKIQPESVTYVQTLYSAPFADTQNSTVSLSVLWPQGGAPVVLAELLSLTGGNGSAALYLLGTSLKQTAAVNEPSCMAVSSDNTHIAFGVSNGIAVYDVQSGKLTAQMPGESAVSLQWKNNDFLYAGGDKTVREWNVAEGVYRILFLSSVDTAAWNHEDNTVSAAAGSASYIYDSEKNIWTASSVPPAPYDYTVQNGRYRVYTGETQNAFFDNAVYVRTLAGKAVTLSLLPQVTEKKAPRREVVLAFDALDNADGLCRILSVLERYHLKCTFFINGEFIRRYPQRTKQIAVSGQECASLFHTAADLTAKGFVVDETFIRRGLARNEDEFYACTGKELTLLWHAPFYKASEAVMKAGEAAGYTYINTPVKAFDTVTLENACMLHDRYYTAGQLINEYMSEIASENGITVLPVSTGVSHGIRSDYLYDNLELLINTLLDAGFDIIPASGMN